LIPRGMAPALVAAALTVAYITIQRTEADGSTTRKPAQKCQQLAPGVNYCQDLGTKDNAETLDIRLQRTPESCVRKAVSKGQLLLHYTGHASLTPAEPGNWVQFEAVEDFTRASAVKMGVGEVPAGWDMALEGLCEGTMLTLTVPPSLGFDTADGKPPRPASVPPGATLRYEMEIVSVLRVDEHGVPFRPCFFSLIDTDGSGDLDEVELARHFARIKQQMPAHVMSEDKDNDGRISWEEFTGPKLPRQRISQDKTEL